MMPMDGKLLLYASGAFAATISAVYIFWGPQTTHKSRKNRRKDICPGLINTGNTCFLNAVLQGMAPCHSFVNWLLESLNSDADSKMSKYTTETLHKILTVLNNAGEEDVTDLCPAEVVHAVRSRGWYISAEEQDAHELFHVLMQSIDEEKTGFQDVVSLFNVIDILDDRRGRSLTNKAALSKSGNLLPLLPDRNSESPFHGQLATQLQCTICKTKKPVRYGQFDSLTLTMPDGARAILTLDMLIRHFLSYEILNEVTCEECKKVSASFKPSAFMTSKIGKLPQCLCIHIQRSVYMNNGLPLKRDDYVSFPEHLDMSCYVQHQKSGQQHRKSDLSGGHLDQPKRSSVDSVENTKPSPLQPSSLMESLNYTNLKNMNQISGIVMRQPTLSQKLEQQNQESERYVTSASNQTITQNTYKLMAVLSHHGDVNSGHFVAYRRAPSSGKQILSERWLYTSDMMVRRAPLDEVLAANAYMLFYERL